MRSSNMKTKITALFALLLVLNTAIGRENVNSTGDGGSGDGQKLTNSQKVMGGCTQGKTQSELKLNNVRARLLTCGDMWWDLNSNPKYEVPKGSGSYASFAGSLWFGGYVNSQLRISAMTYRQNGIDFWPGPLDPSTVDVDAATCNAYDKHWRFNRTDVDAFYANVVATQNGDYAIPSWIKDYPGTAPSSADPYRYLAPFVDQGGDGEYNWDQGDYPAYNVTGAPISQGNCKKLLFGDETLFWVFNDKGNSHLESGSVNPIGVEIRAQAFAFATADVLNDMTFYNFEIINRSSNILDSTYFAVWVDADLGNYQDDYVGCDVVRGLGYIYNGDNLDEDGNGVVGYGSKLPALGCDFFQGPTADINDGVDNDRDGCIDCTYEIDPNTGLPDLTQQIDDDVLGEPISMAKFLPYNNTGDAKTGNPTSSGNGIQFYRYMLGKWKDGTPMRYDLGPGTSTVSTVPTCSYMFPGTSDPNGFGLGGTVQTPVIQPNWTEVIAGNTPGDRRFLQSAGKFTLQPGAINNITFGMPFVRTNSDNNFAAIPLLLIADDKAQSLFDNCFKVLDGPDAPDLTIQEMENQLIVFFSNKESSNNYEQKRYTEIDPTITPLFGAATDRTYRFEGYMVYQLKDESVSSSELYNENKARLVFQCDKKNGVGTIINYTTDPVLGSVPQLMTPEGNDKGIINSFVLNEDMFAEGNKTLVNHKTYYYMAVSYAYNNYLSYVQDVAPGVDSIGNDVHTSGDYAGQKKPFLQGRKNIKTYSAVPHNFAPEANGTTVSTYYGYGPKVKRIEGQGNGGNILNLTDVTVNSILSSPEHRAVELEYENLQGPIQVKVIDPLKVLSGNFIVKIKDVVKTAANKDSLIMGHKDSLDYGKVAGNAKYQVEGTYTTSSGQTISKVWTADEIMSVGQEQILIGDNDEPIGISLTVNTTNDPEPNKAPNTSSVTASSSLASELLFSDLSFSSATSKWLTGVVDTDSETDETNWIRSGTASFGSGATFNDISVTGTDGKAIYADPSQVWEGVVGGTWAPFRLCAAGALNATANQLKMAPSLGYNNPSFKHWDRQINNELDNRNLAGVDIVFTSDKNKWTRCVVLEMGFTNTANIGLQRKFLPRKSQSVNKNGTAAGVGSGSSTNANDANYISETGMGWFPGYAINVETGERLNIAFGENSSDSLNNGRDMFWNPTKTVKSSTGANVFGGMHYIYVFGHNSDGVSGGSPIDVPRYDAGAALFAMLNKTVTAATSSGSTGYGQSSIVEAYKDVMWVNIPLISSGFEGSFTRNNQPSIPADAKVRIRVAKPLRYGLAGTWGSNYSIAQTGTTPANFAAGTTFLNSLSGADLTKDTVAVSQNNNFPMYSFSTEGLGAKTNVNETAKNALDIINIVPNPYYGHSKYEKTRIDNYVKIVNLPVKCTIRIYSVNGTLLKTIKKDTDATTNIQWDLKNDKNILLSSGLYIIHVDAGDLGEKILKWFCVMRPIDLQSY